MSKITGLRVILLSTLVLVVNANFDISLYFCRFRCGEDTCTDNSVETTDVGKIKGYYWRDYVGVIPPDALLLGASDQYPRTYIGRVLDTSHKGTFFTTIVEGLDYVYSTFEGNVTKLTDFIEILCTMEPKKFSWEKLTKDNTEEILKTKSMVGGTHHFITGGAAKLHYIVKSQKCQIVYASYAMTTDGDKVEFALIDGHIEVLDGYEFLLFDKEDSKEESEELEGRSFFTHYYKYNIVPGSIMPKFYKKITIGSCSVTCTNENKELDKPNKDPKKPRNTMEYYWKPEEIFSKSKEDALKAGFGEDKKTLYVGRTFNPWNWLEVGGLDNQLAIVKKNMILTESFRFSVLSTKQPGNFEWVKTTSKDFPKLDRSRMIRGGKLDNGTLTYVGRITKKTSVLPASVRLFEKETVAFSSRGASDTFEILMTKEKF